VEELEPRFVLSPATLLHIEEHHEFHPVIVAGDPNGSPADSPSNRVDPNTSGSPFAGVGSLQISTRRGTYICTGTLINSTTVLSAAHCVDINNDGRVDSKDGIKSITFIINREAQTKITASSWRVHPDYTGFNKPSVNDDLSVITLSSAAPSGVPTYALYSDPLTAGTTLTMVGYGRSGDGVSGYYVSASFGVKRIGQNNADAFYGQDDSGKPAANEVFRFDFDGPTGNGTFGGATLGNDSETTLGGGDSGGPSFVNVGGTYYLAGVNTFTQGFNAPLFGSLGGGIAVHSYIGWINGASPSGGDSGDGGGGKGRPNSVLVTMGSGAADVALPVLLVGGDTTGDAFATDVAASQPSNETELLMTVLESPLPDQTLSAGDEEAVDLIFAETPELNLAWKSNGLAWEWQQLEEAWTE
jgi:hypothetical protein